MSLSALILLLAATAVPWVAATATGGFESFDAVVLPTAPLSNQATFIVAGRLTKPADAIAKLLGKVPLETICCSLLAVVLAQMWRGKRRNKQLVENLGQQELHPWMHENFAAAGFAKSFLKEYGWNSFEAFATGRSTASYCLVKLQCRARQCIWHCAVLDAILDADGDCIELEIPYTCTEPLALVLGQKLQLKYLRELNQDVGYCVALQNVARLSPRLCALSDGGVEVVEKLITPEVEEILNRNAERIRFLAISDLVPSDRFAEATRDGRVLRASFCLPPSGRANEITPLLNAVLKIVDSLPTVRLTDSARNKVKQSREGLEKKRAAESEEDRQEALNKKKQEKRQQELERVRKMSPEMRKAWEEKQQRREAKQRLPKFKIIKG